MVGRARERTNSGIIILFSDNVKPMGFVGTEVCEVAVLSFTVTSRPVSYTHLTLPTIYSV